MRMLACLLPLVAIAAAPATEPGTCPTTKISQADAGKRPLVHPLAQEPGAHQEIAVLRLDEHGCTKPVVVSENIGGISPLVAGSAPSAQMSSTSRP